MAGLDELADIDQDAVAAAAADAADAVVADAVVAADAADAADAAASEDAIGALVETVLEAIVLIVGWRINPTTAAACLRAVPGSAAAADAVAYDAEHAAAIAAAIAQADTGVNIEALVLTLAHKLIELRLRADERTLAGLMDRPDLVPGEWRIVAVGRDHYLSACGSRNTILQLGALTPDVLERGRELARGMGITPGPPVIRAFLPAALAPLASVAPVAPLA